MDDLIGALFLIFFAGVALLRKVLEHRQTGQEPTPSTDAEEELVRKVREYFEGPKPESQAPKPLPETATHPPQPTPRQSAEEAMRRAREQQAQAQRRAAELRRRAEAAKQAQQRQASEQAKRGKRPSSAATPERRVPAPSTVQRPKRARRATGLLRDLSDAQRGIILGELLGPPKGLQ